MLLNSIGKYFPENFYVFVHKISLYVSFSLLSLSGFGHRQTFIFFFICLLICLIVCLLGVDSFLLSTVELSSLCSGVYDLEFLILLSLPPNYYFSFLLTSGIIVCLLT